MLRDLVNTQAILMDKLPIRCLGARCFSLMTPGRAQVSHPGRQQYPRVSYNHPGRNEDNLKRHQNSPLCNNGPEEIVIFLRSSWEKENSRKVVPARGPVCFLERNLTQSGSLSAHFAGEIGVQMVMMGRTIP